MISKKRSHQPDRSKVTPIYSSYKHRNRGFYERQNTTTSDRGDTYFNDTLTNQVVDMNWESAIAFLNESYGYPSPEKIEKYLAVVGELRPVVGG